LAIVSLPNQGNFPATRDSQIQYLCLTSRTTKSLASRGLEES